MSFHQTRTCLWSIPSRVVVLLTAWCCAADCPAADLDSLLNQTGFTGGLCVHLAGGGDGSRTVRLAQGGKLLVHRLDNNASRVAKVRRFIESKGLYGQISVEHWTSRTLPYSDNLVNILVADDTLGISEDEMLRVLCPKGTMILKQGETYRMVRKPRSPRMGEWTHPWHGANGNMFSEDTYLGIPNGVQWVAGPLFPLDARKSSAHGLVSANGRIFNLTQNELSNLNRVGQSLPNFLVARDAYNGLRLWRRPWKGPEISG
ncbi:MAG: hypothetical protein IH899_16485, partial [Planctomycetes bacterium]|nr:hypothetical protein [Planctomycetota bacterium]